MLSESNLIVVFDVQLVNSANGTFKYTENWVQGTWAFLDFGIPGSPGINPRGYLVTISSVKTVAYMSISMYA